MTRDSDAVIEERLETMIALMQQMVALELFERGLSREDIGKHLHVAKAKVVEMLRGVDKGE